jgi:hypothetical protein
MTADGVRLLLLLLLRWCLRAAQVRWSIPRAERR